MDSPDKPKKTAEQVAAERRQTLGLNREIQDEERRLRALSQRRLGASSLLAGLPGSGGSSGATASTAGPRGLGGGSGGGGGSNKSVIRKL